MKKVRIAQTLIMSFIFLSIPLQAGEPVWLLVDTQALNIEVKKGFKTLAIMNNISIGRNGAGVKQQLGDDITPVGTYKIGWVNNKSKFHKFYGFDYPSIDNANYGLKKGYLSNDSYDSIIKAHKLNKVPPQNTPIGGVIGIHGLGIASEKIHNLFNWTHGCIALTNRQIDKLSQWMNKGMLVTIK